MTILETLLYSMLAMLTVQWVVTFVTKVWLRFQKLMGGVTNV